MAYNRQNLQRVADLAAARSSDATRHKCFISYHQKDEDEVRAFIEEFSEVFIAKVLGVSDEDDFIDSTNTDYVLRRIREKYLTDSTVTLVMVGRCTWARKYVDWEIAATLRNDPNNKRSGLLGITLPSVASLSGRRPPQRLDINLPRGGGEAYARWIKYPSTKGGLRSSIEDAFQARNDSDRYRLIKNSAALFKNNRKCP